MDESKSKIILSKQDGEEVEIGEELETTYKPSFHYDTSLIPLTILDTRLDYLDSKTVSKQYYNNFNFSKLSKKFADVKVSLGVTSANKGEGKTLVAANMAVSLVKAYRQRTVLVDLNFQNPELHKIFGGSKEPGLVEAMESRILRVKPTTVDNLYLLPTGDSTQYEPGIKDTLALREILYTLKNEFDFVIVDMSSIFPIKDFPIHFINEVDGLLTVIDTKNTRHEHLRKIYKHIDENRFVGYIFNRVTEKK